MKEARNSQDMLTLGLLLESKGSGEIGLPLQSIYTHSSSSTRPVLKITEFHTSNTCTYGNLCKTHALSKLQVCVTNH